VARVAGELHLAVWRRADVCSRRSMQIPAQARKFDGSAPLFMADSDKARLA